MARITMTPFLPLKIQQQKVIAAIYGGLDKDLPHSRVPLIGENISPTKTQSLTECKKVVERAPPPAIG
jgi:hypothetical protein